MSNQTNNKSAKGGPVIILKPWWVWESATRTFYKESTCTCRLHFAATNTLFNIWHRSSAIFEIKHSHWQDKV